MRLSFLFKRINQGFCSTTQPVSAGESIIKAKAQVTPVNNCTN